MQGWKTFIPTRQKSTYLNQLLRVGFDVLDFGSFVSPAASPQMKDTREVVKKLDLSHSQTRLLAIVANERGAREAAAFDEISLLGFPFSVSETFQLRNTHSTMDQSLERVEEIQRICLARGKQLVIYISMAFGNPYADPYSEDIVFQWVKRLSGLGIQIISLADTVGVATAPQVFSVTSYLIGALEQVEIGVHLHCTPANWQAKLEAALQAGCLRFDGALRGVGGCPLAHDALVGNMDTERMLPYFREKGILGSLNEEALRDCSAMAAQIFS
jgi:hydroxymethylglutaryl-CoA lyase